MWKSLALVVALVGIVVGSCFFVKGQFATPKSEPAGNKKIDVVAFISANVPEQHRIEFEDKLLKETVTPLLTQKGYSVDHAYSMTRLAIKNGGMYRAFLKEMKNEPAKDSSRFLFITVVLEPGSTEGRIVTHLAVLDNFVFDAIRANNLFVPPGFKTLWAYSDQPTELEGTDSFMRLASRLGDALNYYDLQFNDKLKSHNYPDLATRN